MKCLILAAGYATRLYPLTENFPKPLLKVGEKTILDWLIDDIETSGAVDEYVVISNHKYYPHFKEWAEGKSYKVTVVDDGTESNEGRLGAVRDVAFAIEKLSIRSDMLVIAGDNVLDFSLCRFIAYAKEKNASCVMRYFEADTNRLRKCGVLTVAADDRIIGMEEKPAEPKSNWCCPPFYYYSQTDTAKVEEGIASGCGTDAPGSYIAWLSSVADVYAMVMPGKRYDIGNLESYENVKREYRGIEIC
jgi:glucose-1-phosphate thymidylyltransferase